MAIELVSFRKYQKNTLQGFASFLLSEVGLEIRDCSVHQKDGKRWIGLPSKPYTDKDGSEKYSYVVKFVEKDKYYSFQKHALAALDDFLKKGAAAGSPKTVDEQIPF